MKRPIAAARLAAFLLALATAPLSGCSSLAGIYGGGPSASPLPPPCSKTFLGEWVLEGQGGEPGNAPPAPPPAGASRMSITRTSILKQDPPLDLGAYRIVGVGGAAVDLGLQGPTPLHIVCNSPDKIVIQEAPDPSSRVWFYRRIPR